MNQIGMQILFEQLYIYMVWGKKKSLPIFFPCLEKTLTPWSSDPKHCPCSRKLFASCWPPSYLLADSCPLPLPTHNAAPFLFDFLICISTFTDFVNFHLHADPSRNHSWLGLQNPLNQKSQLYIFLKFCCLRFGFPLPFPVPVTRRVWGNVLFFRPFITAWTCSA